MNEWLAVLLVLGALVLLIGLIRLAQTRFALDPELTRKAVHIGMGLVCLSFPWLFANATPVLVLGVCATGLLAAMRFAAPLRARFGSVLGGVDRRSFGELLFPLGVALAFALVRGAPAPYLAAVMVLTFADAAAALVGRRISPRAPGKTWVGSLAFLLIAIPCVWLPLTARAKGVSVPLSALSLGTAVALTLLEAISRRGLDNLILPVATVLLLRLAP